MSFIVDVKSYANHCAATFVELEKTNGAYNVIAHAVSPYQNKLIGLAMYGFARTLSVANLGTLAEQTGGAASAVLKALAAATGQAQTYSTSKSYGIVPAEKVESSPGVIDPQKAVTVSYPAVTDVQQAMSSVGNGTADASLGANGVTTGKIQGLLESGWGLALLAFGAWLLLKK